MITIGRLAEKFGMLPSQVAEHATTYDLMITDVLATYDKYQQQKANGKLIDPSVYNLSQEDLLKMVQTNKQNE